MACIIYGDVSEGSGPSSANVDSTVDDTDGDSLINSTN